MPRRGDAWRARLLQDLPRALADEEARAFAAAKRAEAAGMAAEASRLFAASREAFHAQEEIRAARTREERAEVLQRAHRLWQRLVNTV